MKKVKDFIEAVDKDSGEYYQKVFAVTFEEVSIDNRHFWIPTPMYRRDSKVITLDEEDIKYLYDKYKPFLAAELEKQTEEEKAKILKEIETKSKQINKLSDEIREIKDKL